MFWFIRQQKASAHFQSIIIVIRCLSIFLALTSQEAHCTEGCSGAGCDTTCPPTVLNLDVTIQSVNYTQGGQLQADFSVYINGEGYVAFGSSAFKLFLYSKVEGVGGTQSHGGCQLFDPNGTCVTCDTTKQVQLTLPNPGVVTFIASAEEYNDSAVRLCRCTSFVVVPVSAPPFIAEREPIPCEAQMGDPIDARHGNVHYSKTDVAIGSWFNFPLEFTRHYNSFGDNEGVLGPRWKHSFEYTYADVAGGFAGFSEGTGRIVHLKDSYYPIGIGHKYIVDADTSGRHTVTELATLRRYVFNADGTLDTLADRDYGRIFFSYDNGLLDTIFDAASRFITFHYDQNDKLQYLKLPDSTVLVTYEYDSSVGDTLKKVTYTDSTWESYTYSSVLTFQGTHDGLLATIENSDGVKRNFDYDLIARGSRSDLNDTLNVTTAVYGLDVEVVGGDTTIIYYSDETGLSTTTYESIFSADTSNRQLISITNSCCAGDNINFTYDTLFNRNTITYGNGLKDSMFHGASGQVETYVNGVDEDFERTHDYTYAGTYNLLSTYEVASIPNDQSQYTIDYTRDSDGNITAIQRQGYTTASGAFDDTTDFSYNSEGQLTFVEGPNDTLADTTKYVYYGNGDLQYVIQSNGDTVTYGQLNDLGQVTWVKSPNGDTTRYVFGQHGRMLQYIVRAGTADALTTKFERNFAGDITKVINPESDTTDYIYDGNGLLSDIVNPHGEKIHYFYDDYTRVTREVVVDSTGDTVKTESYTYTDKNQVERIVNPDATYIEYEYDNMGNIAFATDANGNITRYDYDLRNNPDTIKQFITGGWHETVMAYDGNSNVTKVIDPDSNVYVYAYSDKNQLVYDSSGITGVATHDYDPVGNLIWKKNAAGDSISYNYDLLNRLISMLYPDSGNIRFVYDGTEYSYGDGRLYKEITPICTTKFQYDKYGRLAAEVRKYPSDTTTYVTSYAYDKNDNLTQIAYPSGHLFYYTYDDANQVRSIKFRPKGLHPPLITIVDSIEYMPYGGAKKWWLGNGIWMYNYYNNRYLIDSITCDTSNAIGLAYTYDAVGNIENITNLLDSTKDRIFTYDELNQLASAISSDYPESTFVFYYSKNGNRDSLVVNVDTLQRTVSYTYTDNKLTEIDDTITTTLAYDSLGNLILVVEGSDTTTYEYNDAGQLASVDNGVTADYYYDGRNRRIRKVVGGSNTRNYFYSPQGLMLSEFRASTGWDVDYVYLNGLPIAKIVKHYDPQPDFLLLDTIGDPPPPPGQEPYYDIFWYHNDHLGTPQALTNKNKTVVWRGEYLPYGELYYEMVSTSNDIRFPGQWHDRETNLHYNWHRYYEPRVGRYTQSDPIGLLGGFNPYRYTSNNSINWFDASGLDDNTSPWQVGWEWLTGTGPRARYFTDHDPFTERLKQHEHIQNLIRGVSNCDLPIEGTYNYNLSGWQGIPKYAADYSTLLTGGLTGNLGVTYLGSYEVRYKLTDVNVGSGIGILNVHVTNASTISSATHPPLVGYTSWWQKNIGDPLNSFFSSGPLSRTMQVFDLHEYIMRNCKCQN